MSKFSIRYFKSKIEGGGADTFQEYLNSLSDAGKRAMLRVAFDTFIEGFDVLCEFQYKDYLNVLTKEQLPIYHKAYNDEMHEEGGCCQPCEGCAKHFMESDTESEVSDEIMIATHKEDRCGDDCFLCENELDTHRDGYCNKTCLYCANPSKFVEMMKMCG